MLAATRNRSINRLRDHNRHVLWHLGTVHLDGDIRISLNGRNVRMELL